MDEQEEWSECWSVGIDGIDEEHRYFIYLLNLFNDTGDDALTGERLHEVVGELLTYTEEHFTNEEKVMEAAGYPLYEDHKEQHDLAEDEIRHLMTGAVSDSQVRAFLGRFMLNWLVLHIQSSDQKLSGWLRDNGVEYHRSFDAIIDGRDWMKFQPASPGNQTAAAQ